MYGKDRRMKKMGGGYAEMMKGGKAKRTMYKDGGMSKAKPC